MSDQDLFSNNQTNTQPKVEDGVAKPVTQEDHSDPFADKLTGIVNEDGKPKYKDTATALDALKASQEFIEQLKREKHEADEKVKNLEQEMGKQEAVEDFVNKLNQRDTQRQGQSETPDSHKSLSVEEVKELLEQQLTQRELQSSREKNLSLVVSELNTKFGDQASAEIKKKAQELGTDPSRLKELAKESPQMVLSIFSSSSTVSDSPSKPTLNSSAPIKPGNDRPEVERGRSAASGGLSSSELVGLFRKSKDYTNNRLGIK